MKVICPATVCSNSTSFMRQQATWTLLHGVREVHCFKIDGVSLKFIELLAGKNYGQQLQLLNLDNLEVRSAFTIDTVPALDFIFKSCPCLFSLTLHMDDPRGKETDMNDGELWGGNSSNIENYLKAHAMSILKKLEMLKIYGIRAFSLLKILLRNGTALKKTVLCTSGNSLQETTKNELRELSASISFEHIAY